LAETESNLLDKRAQRKRESACGETETRDPIFSARAQCKYQKKCGESRSDAKVEASFDNARFDTRYISKE
jgi:hypothetical protein